MQGKWKLLVATLVLAIVWVANAYSSQVTVGVMSKAGPGQVATCQLMVDGINPLGSGVFSDLVTGAVISDLADPQSATTVLTLDATNVPAGLCVTEGLAVTTAEAACTVNYTVLNLRPVVDSDDLIAGFIWNCAKITSSASPFWVYAECP